MFGYFTDFGSFCVSGIPADRYFVRVIMVVTGTVILGFGVSLTVAANVVMNPGEAIVRVVAKELDKNFGNVKIALDVSYVAASLLLSLIFFNGKIVGAREGTIFAAVFSGIAVKFFSKRLKKPLEAILTVKKT